MCLQPTWLCCCGLQATPPPPRPSQRVVVVPYECGTQLDKVQVFAAHLAVLLRRDDLTIEVKVPPCC